MNEASIATVVLLRHGTSPIGAGRDRDRPLGEGMAERLRRGATALQAANPFLMIASPARRTLETADAVASVLDIAERRTLDDLYNADGATILRRIEDAVAEHPAVLVVGHNPGISAAASELTGGRVDTSLRPGDAVIVRRDGAVWSFVDRIAVQAS